MFVTRPSRAGLVQATVLRPWRILLMTSYEVVRTYPVIGYSHSIIRGVGTYELVGPQVGQASAPELRRVLPASHEEAYRIVERYTADLVQRAEDEAAHRNPPAEQE